MEFERSGNGMLVQLADLWSIMHPVTLSWHWVDQSYPYPVNLSAKQRAASTNFNDFGMSRPGIEPMISYSSERTLYLLSYWAGFQEVII